MSKLYDIYFSGAFGDKTKVGQDYVLNCHYIADTYYSALDGYKPFKTTRIGIFLSNEKLWGGKPFFTGSIVALPCVFDFSKYLECPKALQQKYLLDLMHQTIIEYCTELKWDKLIFENAYKYVLDNNLEYIKQFPVKVNRDKQNKAQIIIRKNINETLTFLNINNKELLFFKSQNRFCLDPIPKLVSKNKWLDKSSFGISAELGEMNFFYSLDKKSFDYQIIAKRVDQSVLEKKYKFIIEQIIASH